MAIYNNIVKYIATLWKNYPVKETSINASRLNHLEQGVVNVTDFINTLPPTENGNVISDTNYTQAEKTKLGGIEERANNYSLPLGSKTVRGGFKIDDVSVKVNDNGELYSPNAGISELNKLIDVDVTALANNSILKYNWSIKKWVCVTDIDAKTSLKELNDVELSSPMDNGNILSYDLLKEKWINIPSPLAKFNIENPLPNQTIKYDAATSKWIPVTLSDVAFSGLYSDLKDIPDNPGELTYQETMDVLNGSEMPPEPIQYSDTIVIPDVITNAKSDLYMDDITIEELLPEEV